MANATGIRVLRRGMLGLTVAAGTPLEQPVAGFDCAATTDLPAGATLDCLAGFTCYGLTENHVVVRRERLLPIGLAEGCRLLEPLARDQLITWDHLEPPPPDANCQATRRAGPLLSLAPPRISLALTSRSRGNLCPWSWDELVRVFSVTSGLSWSVGVPML